MKFKVSWAGVLILLLGSALSAQAADWYGRVSQVAEAGDVLTIMTDDNRRLTLRLYGVDCPQPGQPFAVESENMVRALVVDSRQPVTVLEEARESSGQVVATIVLADGTTLNDRLLVAGLAWFYPEHCPDAAICRGMMTLEQKARQQRRGLWAQDNPISPWEWNEQKFEK